MFACQSHIRADDHSHPGAMGVNAMERKLPETASLFEAAEYEIH
jgi:hypothetical protein